MPVLVPDRFNPADPVGVSALFHGGPERLVHLFQVLVQVPAQRHVDGIDVVQFAFLVEHFPEAQQPRFSVQQHVESAVFHPVQEPLDHHFRALGYGPGVRVRLPHLLVVVAEGNPGVSALVHRLHGHGVLDFVQFLVRQRFAHVVVRRHRHPVPDAQVLEVPLVPRVVPRVPCAVFRQSQPFRQPELHLDVVLAHAGDHAVNLFFPAFLFQRVQVARADVPRFVGVLLGQGVLRVVVVRHNRVDPPGLRPLDNFHTSEAGAQHQQLFARCFVLVSRHGVLRH